MRDIGRWAVYFAPKMNCALARFGADWLGWDAQAGRAREGLDPPGLPRPRAEIVAAARRYGLHGTLKPPFRLTRDREPGALNSELLALAADFAPFSLSLELAEVGDFLALVPTAPVPELDRLAAACVTRLDGFRAPPLQCEIARRDPGRLSPAQRENLAVWGYPYVLDEFRFHITLTGPLPAEERAAIARALAPVLEAPLGPLCEFADVCLFGEDRGGLFHLLQRFPLSGARER